MKKKLYQTEIAYKIYRKNYTKLFKWKNYTKLNDEIFYTESIKVTTNEEKSTPNSIMKYLHQIFN